jgi:uncharacterized OsmC-like protein
MGTATVKWISGKQFIGIDSPNHSVVLSTPYEGVDIKPSDLLLLALAACTAVDVVEILEKKRMPSIISKSVAVLSRIQTRAMHFARPACGIL